jgi:hypothetical protein
LEDFVAAAPFRDFRNGAGMLASELHQPLLGNRRSTVLIILLACRPVFGIVVALLVKFQMGSARQRPRTLPAASTFPLF